MSRRGVWVRSQLCRCHGGWGKRGGGRGPELSRNDRGGEGRGKFRRVEQTVRAGSAGGSFHPAPLRWRNGRLREAEPPAGGHTALVAGPSH